MIAHWYSLTAVARISPGARFWFESAITKLFRQQFFDVLAHDLFSLLALPVQFAVPPVADIASLVDEINARPHRVAPGVPVFLVVIRDDREFEFGFGRFSLHFVEVVFVVSLGGMNAEDDEVLSSEIVLPAPVPGVIAYAVDSAIGPEVHGDDFSAQVGESQRGRVEPLAAGKEFRRFERDLAQLFQVKGVAEQSRELFLLTGG